jgi:hypothetical protein
MLIKKKTDLDWENNSTTEEKKNATTKTTQPTTKEQVLFCKTMQLLSNSR